MNGSRGSIDAMSTVASSRAESRIDPGRAADSPLLKLLLRPTMTVLTKRPRRSSRFRRTAGCGVGSAHQLSLIDLPARSGSTSSVAVRDSSPGSSGRHPFHRCAGWYVPDDARGGSDGRTRAHRQALQDRGGGADDDPLSNDHRAGHARLGIEPAEGANTRVMTDGGVLVDLNVAINVDGRAESGAWGNHDALGKVDTSADCCIRMHQYRITQPACLESIPDPGPKGRRADRNHRVEAMLSRGEHRQVPQNLAAEGIDGLLRRCTRSVVQEALDRPPGTVGVQSLRDRKHLPAEPTAPDDHQRSHRSSWCVPVNSGIVASPVALIPVRRSTRPTVRTRIRRSSSKEREDTYSTSRRSRSLHDRALRPATWASPVRPGGTSWRRACSAL